jgi:hypothetical protein
MYCVIVVVAIIATYPLISDIDTVAMSQLLQRLKSNRVGTFYRSRVPEFITGFLWVYFVVQSFFPVKCFVDHCVSCCLFSFDY